MNTRKERILENWLANTIRHCRATRLFDLEVHRLSREEQVDLASACLDYFENEAERRLRKNSGKPDGSPSPQGQGGDGKGRHFRRPKLSRY